jgi:hypothetical protein
VALGGSAVLVSQTNRRPLPLDFDDYAQFLPVAMTGTMFVLLVVNVALALLTRDQMVGVPRPFKRYAGGLSPWAASSTGLFVGVGFCGAFVLGIARLVGAEANTELIFRIAYAWGLTVLLLGAMTVIGLGYVVVVGRRLRPEVEAGYEEVYGAAMPESAIVEEMGSISTARTVATLKRAVPHAFVTWAAAGLAMTAVTSLEMLDVELPGILGWLSGDDHDGTMAAFLINLGTYALIGLATLLMFLGRRALRGLQARRGVNVVWDVVSFWPHSAHPFVPPAYSQFAVRDLRRRIRYHLAVSALKPPDKERARSLVLSAHSQGSLLAFATLLWLGDEEIDKLGLVTYGSQLQVAFPRAFPAYVNYELIVETQRRLHNRWVNLYRETDPIAGPVLSWGRDRRVNGSPTSHRVGETCEQDERDADGQCPVRPDQIVPPTGRRESGNDWRVLDPLPPGTQLQVPPPLLPLFRHSHFPVGDDYADAVDLVNPARVLSTPAG